MKRNQSLLHLFMILVFFVGGLIPIKNELVNTLNIDLGPLTKNYLANGISNFRYFVIKDKVFNRVLAAQDNWLNYIGELSLDDYQNAIPFTDNELVVILNNLTRINDLLERQGIEFYLIIPPNKSSIYPEYMPDEIPVLGIQSRLDQLVIQLYGNENIKLIDLRSSLKEARNIKTVYYHSDSHWNSYGAWIAYHEISEILSKDFKEIKPHDLKEYRSIQGTFNQGDLALIAGNLQISEEETYLYPIFNDDVILSNEVRNDIKYVITEKNTGNLPRAVIFRDSFYTGLLPLLADHFSYAIHVWSSDFDKQIVEEAKPDIVIFEVSERYIHKLLYLP